MISSLIDRIIFPASREVHTTPAAMGWDYQDLVLDVGDEQTHGWWVPLAGARATVLFSHGNAGNIADRLQSIGLLREMGFSVLAYDYGGYGKSSGRAGEQRFYADIRAMWAWLTETQGVPPSEIILFGRSLGAAVTADLAAEVVPAATILESTFLSMPKVAKVHTRFPVQWFLRHHFHTEEKVARIQSPLLIVHSPDDTLIPYAHGTTLYERAKAPKTFLEIGGDHNDGFAQSLDIYKAGWEKFLAPLLPMRRD